MENSSTARSLFFFDTMLMPKIITFIYWLLLVMVLLAAVGSMIEGGEGFFMGIGVLVFGVVGVRLWCELMIVLFKINENIQKIADKA